MVSKFGVEIFAIGIYSSMYSHTAGNTCRTSQDGDQRFVLRGCGATARSRPSRSPRRRRPALRARPSAGPRSPRRSCAAASALLRRGAALRARQPEHAQTGVRDETCAVERAAVERGGRTRSGQGHCARSCSTWAAPWARRRGPAACRAGSGCRAPGVGPTRTKEDAHGLRCAPTNTAAYLQDS